MTALMALLGLTLAADPGALALERARAAMAREDHGTALAELAAARDAGEGDAHRWYLALATARHTETLADAEYVHLAETDPVARAHWLWSRAERGLAEADDLDAGLPPDLMRRARVALLLADGDPEGAAALARTDVSAQEARLALQAKVQQGPLDDAVKLGKQLLAQWPEDPSVLTPLWSLRGDGKRYERARERLLRQATRRLGEDPLRLYRALRLCIAARDKERAGALADQLAALGEPRPLTRANYNRRMVSELARALARHSAPQLPVAAPSETLQLARGLARQLRDAGQQQAIADVWRQAAERTGDVGAWASLSEALLTSGEAAAALEAARAGLLAGAQRAEASRHKRARAHAAAAGAYDALEQPQEALLQLQEAALLDPRPAYLEAQARHLEAAGQLEGAFLLYVRARQAGAEELEEALARTYQGPATWEVAANAVVAPRPEPDASPPARPEMEAPSYPWLGTPLPDSWTAQDPEGEERFPDALAGRVVVLSFWASWCGPCRQELPVLDRLATRLTEEGLDVAFVGVGVDKHLGDYRRFTQRSRCTSLDLLWSPELGAALGVRGIPATWVMDSSGVLRAFYAGYETGMGDRIEADVRFLLQDGR